MVEESINKSVIGRCTVWLLTLEPILLQYKVGQFNVGVLLMLALFISGFIKNRKIYIDRDFGFFIIILVIQQLLSVYVVGGDFNNRINNIILAIMIFFACSNLVTGNFDCDYAIERVFFVAIVTSLPIFYQFYLIYGRGMSVSSIMIFPQSSEKLEYWVTNSYRPCGLFTEPQTYCTYMIPIIIIALRKNRLWIALFLISSIVLTGSSLGIMVSMFLLGIYIFASDLRLSKKIAIILLLLIIGVFFTLADAFTASYDKITNIFNSFSEYSTAKMVNSGSYSNYLRMVKGWKTLFEMPMNAKIFGVGISGFRYYMMSNHIVFSWSRLWDVESANSAYYSSFAGVFIECGLFVGYIYYRYIKRKIKKGSKIGKTIFLTLLFQSMFTQIFFNGIFVMYFMYYYAYSSVDKKLCLTL